MRMITIGTIILASSLSINPLDDFTAAPVKAEVTTAVTITPTIPKIVFIPNNINTVTNNKPANTSTDKILKIIDFMLIFLPLDFIIT